MLRNLKTERQCSQITHNPVENIKNQQQSTPAIANETLSSEFKLDSKQIDEANDIEVTEDLSSDPVSDSNEVSKEHVVSTEVLSLFKFQHI